MSIFSGVNNPGLDFEQLTSAELAILQQITGLGDPNADRILFWDDSAGSYAWLTAGSGLTITGTTITASTASGINRSITVTASSGSAGATASTDYVYLVSGTSTITLPTAVGNTNLYTIKNVGAGTVTVDTTSSQTIDGSLTVAMAVANTSLSFLSDNTNWAIV